MFLFFSVRRGREWPLPAGMGGPVSSAFWCEFHPSGESMKVPVMLGKHNRQHRKAHSLAFSGTLTRIHTVAAILIGIFAACTVAGKLKKKVYSLN